MTEANQDDKLKKDMMDYVDQMNKKIKEHNDKKLLDIFQNLQKQKNTNPTFLRNTGFNLGLVSQNKLEEKQKENLTDIEKQIFDRIKDMEVPYVEMKRDNIKDAQSLDVPFDIVEYEKTIREGMSDMKAKVLADMPEITEEIWDFYVNKVASDLLKYSGEKKTDREILDLMSNLFDEILVGKKFPHIEIDGKTLIGFKNYDIKDGGLIMDAQLFTEDMNDEMRRMTEQRKEQFDLDQKRGIYDMECQKETLNFCRKAGQGLMLQFRNKTEFFNRRADLIEEASIYRFKDKFISLLVEHNKNDIGFRPMPRNNMWIECSMLFDDILITGIHLHKIRVNKDGDSYQIYDGDIMPVGFEEEAISVFFTGFAKDTAFYSYFPLSRIVSDIELRKKTAKYYCPNCNSPMLEISKGKFYCDLLQCVKLYQKGLHIVYDMKDPKVKPLLNAWKINDIWSVEQRIKLFVCNLLDFITFKQVTIENPVDEKQMKVQNEKRAKRGKPALMPVNIINVTGFLEKKISLWRTHSRGSYVLARNETTVDGFYRRFWKKDKWTRLYSWIKKGKNAEEIRELLSKLIKMDEDGHPLPPDYQYKWDDYYKVIYTWIPSFKKFEGEGIEKQRIHLIEVEDEKKGDAEVGDTLEFMSDE